MIETKREQGYGSAFAGSAAWLSLIVILVALFAACSNERNPNSLPGAHPEKWIDKSSPDFHGRVVLQNGVQSCVKCHGADFNGGVVKVSCIDCHTKQTDLCIACHGGMNHENKSGAPPFGLRDETTSNSLAVGAHSIHLAGSAIAGTIPCVTCHHVPGFVLDSTHFDYSPGGPVGYTDSVAEITWSELGVRGGQSSWDRRTRTCAAVYCHGNFDGGHRNNTPIWTGDSSQAACGTCHDIGVNPASLGWKHAYHVSTLKLKCADCHASVVDATNRITTPILHVNGIIDTLRRDSALCNTCHGTGSGQCVRCHGGLDNQTGAPPRSLRGDTTAITVGVGAHSRHVQGGVQADAFSCNECHKTPITVADSGHIDIDSVAEITWGGISNKSGTPSWNRTTQTCRAVYCHGNFAGGHTNNNPRWTGTDQATCGSCHDIGANPGSLSLRHEFHITVASLKCVDCHANVVDSSLHIINTSLHVNGVIDTLRRDTALCNLCHGPSQNKCVTCHGGVENQSGAPPKGLHGETSETTMAVGAHTRHMNGGAQANGIPCRNCHVVPSAIPDPGHLGTDSIAEIVLSGLGGKNDAARWDRSTRTCNAVYCHGGFPGGNGSNAPVWTGGSAQAACGTCHDAGADPAKLAWKHAYHVGTLKLKCADCHANVVDTNSNIANTLLHVNGVVDTLRRDTALCNSCHGAGTDQCVRCHGGLDNATGAPPKALHGETAPTSLPVGAHTKHLQGGANSVAVACNACHVVPGAILDPSHLGADSIAEITWGSISAKFGNPTWNRISRTCNATYCHGNFSGGNLANNPGWTGGSGQAACGSCHDTGTNPANLLWKHDLHVTSFGLACADCHANVIDTALKIIGRNLHVNGVVDTLTRNAALCGQCHGTGADLCVRCHGGVDNQTGAPPKGLRGETLTSALAVGAHTKHLVGGVISDSGLCSNCHLSYTKVSDSGHYALDSIAEISWHNISNKTGGAIWNRTTRTCGSTYCHGNFTGGKPANAPIWTGGAGQTTCGSCHDTGTNPSSLLWKHDLHVTSFGLTCADCHSNVVDLSLNIIGKKLHVNGVVDTLTRDTATCNRCHGTGPDACVRCHGGTNNQTGAPPKSLRGDTTAITLGVGAHSRHMQGGSQADAGLCSDCHLTYTQVSDSGHFALDSIAEITWHNISNKNGGANWNRTARTCGSTYCHGNFSGGKTANAPNWTGSNQAACGSCHDVGSSPSSLLWKHELHVTSFALECSDCHASVVDTQLLVTNLNLHVNGAVDTLTRVASKCALCHAPGPDLCVRCHGGTDNQTGAPPKGLRGETLTTTRPVGAHTRHMQGGTMSDSGSCTDCHLLYTSVSDPGHYALDSIAEITWGALSNKTGGATWTRTSNTCASTYCHGNFSGGKSANAPVWIGGSGQAACGSCHDTGAQPSLLLGQHQRHANEGYNCYRCHAGTVSTSNLVIGKPLHVNGTANVQFSNGTGSYNPSTRRCSNPGGCHGTETW